MSKTKRTLLYVGFSIFTFLFFVLALFPYGAVKSRIAVELENSLGADYSVEIESLRPSLLVGLAFKNMKIKQASSGKSVADVPKGVVKLSITPLLWGSLNLGFNLYTGDGKVSGKMSYSGGSLSVKAKLKDLDLGKVGLFKEVYGLNLKSTIGGELQLKSHTTQKAKDTGFIKIYADELRIGQSELKLGSGDSAIPFAIPPLQLASKKDNATIDIALENGRFELKSFHLQGGDLELDLKGKVFWVSHNPSKSRFSLNGEFSTSEHFDKELPYLFIFETEKAENGKYPLAISGRFSSPKVRIGSKNLPF